MAESVPMSPSGPSYSGGATKKNPGNPADPYDGKYKSPETSVSEDDKFGESLNPVRETPLPAKGLKKVGG